MANPKYSAKELQEAIDEYFDDCKANEIGVCREGLAVWLGYSNSAMTHIAWDGKSDRQEILQKAFDRISMEMQVGDVWNGNKFMAQKSMKLLESRDLGGYNTRKDPAQDIKIAIKFGDNVDESCFE